MPLNLTGAGNTLADSLAETCTFRNRSIVPDGLGGFKESYSDGVTFTAFIRKDNTVQDRVAEKQGVKETYTVVVPKAFPLSYHDVFKAANGLTYRVMGNTPNNEPPPSSTIQVIAVTAERWDEP